MTDFFTEGPIDPRIYKELATDMWRVTVSYLPIKDILKLPNLCKYFNEEIVWHPHSGRLLWGEMGTGEINKRVFKTRPVEDAPSGTALIRACYEGAPVGHVSALLAGGANINAVDRLGITALNQASGRGHEGIVRALLGANADPNIANIGGWTPLIRASYNGLSAMVSLLIGAGTATNVNHTDSNGWTALMNACEEHHVDCVRVLVNARADITMRNNQGRTALDIARRYGHRDIISILEKNTK